MTKSLLYDPYLEKEGIPTRTFPGLGNCNERPFLRFVKKVDDDHYPIRGTFVEFLNLGQSLVFINETWPVQPGAHLRINRPCQDFGFRFYAQALPSAVNVPLVHTGNHLVVVVHKQKNAFAELTVPANISTGALTVSTTPPVDLSLTPSHDTTTTDFSIPAAAKFVLVRHVGSLVSGAAANIQVNGMAFTPGSTIKRRPGWDGVNRFILPAYNVVTNGNTVEYYYET